MQTMKKKFEAYNTTTEWKLDNAKQVELESEMNTLFSCSHDAVVARNKILEAEILRDAGVVEVARNFGFTIKSYRQLQVVLQKRPFWNSTINSGKHKCSGAVCIRCRVCNTRSTEHTIEEFIAYRARPQVKSKMQNLDLATQHRCGSENPDEVEFVDSCYLKNLVKDRIYESYREPGVTVVATGSWFMCMNSGLLHYCKNDESCSKMSLEIHDGSPLSYSCALTSLAKKPVVESWQAWDGVHFHSVARINSIQNSIAITRKNGRFEDVPANHTPGKTTDFAIPLAVDNVFDNQLCLSDWEAVSQFQDDERNSSSFQTVNNALLRCIKRKKEIVLKQVKGAVGHTDEQPFHGEPLLHDMEVLVLVNQVMRLVLIFRNNILINYCVKTPKFE